MLTGLSYFGVLRGDLAGANEAGRSGRRAGDPAQEDWDGLEADDRGLFTPLPRTLRPGVYAEGTFLADTLVGLDGREADKFPITTQFACRSPASFSRRIFLAGRSGLVEVCDI